jgi:hypothetical protein
MPSLSDFLCGRERGNPSRPLPALNPLDTWRRIPDSGLRVTWLGHSTTLIEIDGARVLTDPVWGPRASPLLLVGPKRFQPVPVALREMPPVDVVIISHDHYDHLDYPTIRSLVKSDVPFVTSLGVGAHLESWGIPPARITELDWWESTDLAGRGVRVTAAPSQHFSGRTPRLETPRSGRHSPSALNGMACSSVATPASPQSTGIFAIDSGHLILPCSRWARGIRPGVICTWGQRMHSRQWRCWILKHFCQSTGARSAWRCIRGISRPRSCMSMPRETALDSSCRGLAKRSSPGAQRAL